MAKGSIGMCGRLQELGALRPGLTRRRAVDQIEALVRLRDLRRAHSARPSGWSPEQCERWLRDRLREVLLDAGTLRQVEEGNVSRP